MQLNCSKCSAPIALTDSVEFFEAGLAHADCKRVRTLSAQERALVFVYCGGHQVAHCLPCDQRYRFTELATDILGGGATNLCPRCRKDLTESVRGHLYSCGLLPLEVRRRAQAVRAAAHQLMKQAQQARDRADVLMRDAEALLSEQQQALREAMRRRAAS
jgi:hypothetical protein